MGNTVLVVDNVDADNTLAAVAACNPMLGIDLKAVIVTGRFAHDDPTADITAWSPAYSEEVRRRNARRLKGVLTRMGYDVPVFEGLIPPRTLVPHGVHIDEQLLDFFWDDKFVATDGSFQAALAFIASLRGSIDLIVGGPLTEVAAMLGDSRLAGKFRKLTAQMGMFGFGEVETMAGGRRSFNSGCDPDAVRKVIELFPGEVYFVSTDTTKLEEVGFDHPSDLEKAGVPAELVMLTAAFWSHALRARGERIYPHDVHPVLLLSQLNKMGYTPIYGVRSVTFTHVDDDGVITVNDAQESRHYLVRSVDAYRFKMLLGGALRPM